jgi:HPt (histidine-containing phosphotransfer) domain-containing protein
MNSEPFSFNEQLDGQFLESIYDGDCEHAEMVFEQFMNSVKGHLGEIEEGFASGTPEVFRKAVHKFKPVLSFVGLTKLTTNAAMIEKKCSEVTDANSLLPLYTDFKNELNKMIPVVENDLMKLKALTS